MDDPASLGWTLPSGAAFATVRVSTWSEFTDIIETHFLDWSEYIFRGQRCAEWPLISKFDREYNRAVALLRDTNPLDGLEGEDLALVSRFMEGREPAEMPPRDEMLDNHLRRFRDATVGRRGASPSELTNDEWWALGQHFGLSTPLLDWAKSAYVACFFALEEPKAPDSGFRAVWAFSQFGHLEILSNHPANYGKRREELDAIDLIHARIDENGRLISQGGVFTRTPAGEDISSFIDQNVDLSGFAPVLFRIEIPDKHRDLFLRHLELMNIHAGTLFPDLTGAASLANRQFEKESSRRLLMRQPKFLRNLGAALPTHDRTTATDQYLPFDDDGPTGTEVSTSAKARQKMKRR